jgi:hypothetical protein
MRRSRQELKESRARMRLADPTTFAALDAAQKAGEDLYGPKLRAIFQDIKTLLAGRPEKSLAGADAVALMALKAEFDSVAIQQKHHCEAVLAELLNPSDGSETVDA